MNMKFSHFVELITVNKPTDEFYLEITYIFSCSLFYWFCFINTESEITFLNALSARSSL